MNIQKGEDCTNKSVIKLQVTLCRDINANIQSTGTEVI